MAAASNRVPADDLPANLVPADDVPSGAATYDYDALRKLQTRIGATPHEADVLGRIGYAESTGNAMARNAYTENGKRYEVQGLWQVSTIHGLSGMFDPEKAARAALKLYRESGTSPWEDSRSKGAGGGWGQYVGGKGGGGLVPADDLPSAPDAKPTPLPAGGMNAVLRPQQSAHAGGAQPSKSSLTASEAGIVGGLTATPHAPALATAIETGKQLFEALPATRLINAAANTAIGIYHYDMVRRPIETFANVEGTPGRAVMALAGRPGDMKNPLRPVSLADIGHALHETLHPEDTQQLTDTLEQKFAHDLHLPNLAGPGTNVYEKLIADVLVQTATDPFTYIPVVDTARAIALVPKVMANSAVGVAAGKAAIAALRTLGNHPQLGQALKALDAAFTVTKKGATGTGKILNKYLSEKRPDLDVHFEPPAKAARVAMESASKYIETGMKRRDDALLTRLGPELKTRKITSVHPEIMQNRVQNMFRYGDTAARNRAVGRYKYVPTAEDLKRFPQPLAVLQYGPNSTIPDFSALHIPKQGEIHDAAAILTKRGATQLEVAQARALLTRRLVNVTQTAQMTDAYVSHYGGMKYIPPIQGMLHPRDWFAKNIRQPPSFQVAELTNVAKNVASFSKQGIMLNPFPHGLFNVGSIAWMRGGLTTAARGLAYGSALWKGMANPHLDELVERLTKYGARTSYWRTPTGLSRLYGLKKWIPHAQEILDHLETGYRASYLEMLDHVDGTHGMPLAQRQFGPEFEKAARVMNDIGDYDNTTKFAQFLSGIGGLFAVFGADIAPRATWNEVGRAGLLASDKSMRHLPLTPLIARTQRDLNEPDRGVLPPGKEFEFEGPSVGAIRMGVNPVGWLSSPARTGPIVSNIIRFGAQSIEGDAYGFDIGKQIGEEAESALPGYSDLEQIPGFEPLTPYADSSDAPVWMRAWFLLNGGYERPDPDTKTARRKEKSFYKHNEVLEFP